MLAYSATLLRMIVMVMLLVGAIAWVTGSRGAAVGTVMLAMAAFAMVWL